MDELHDSTPPSKRRPLVVVVVVLILVAAAFVGGRLVRLWLTPEPAPAKSAEARPVELPKATPRPVTPAPLEPAPAAPREGRAPKPKPVAEPEPAAPTAGTLRVEADVEGAIAFIDRKFVGNLPVTVDNVAPGPHKLNVSAPGYEGYAEDLDVQPGPRDLTVRFKVVRLSESIPVVHKHGIGSCEGRLVADVEGLRYQTTNKDHAFTASLADLDQFEVEYLKKNLKIKLKNGKTYNFSDKNPNADALYVFQRNVEKARARLAKGDTPVK